MFSGLFRMNETCSHCGLKYEREPGFFLGSIYVNYGVTAVLITVSWVTLQFGFGFQPRSLILPFLVFLVLFQIVFFRYARALWLAMDCRFDRSLFTEAPKEESDARR